jgi:hypothetical protein
MNAERPRGPSGFWTRVGVKMGNGNCDVVSDLVGFGRIVWGSPVEGSARRRGAVGVTRERATVGMKVPPFGFCGHRGALYLTLC